MKKDQHKGQVALVMVLIMTVASALAVSLASRSTADTKIQETESENVQALLFAQTGLEQLVANPSITEAQDTNYYAVKTSLGSDSFEVGRVEIGSSVEVNLDPYPSGLIGFVVNWGPDSGTPGKPAVFVTRVFADGLINDYAFDYDGANGFQVAGSSLLGGYSKSTGQIDLSSSVRKIRVTVLGSPARVNISPVGGVFPSQIVSIRSTGTVDSDDKSVKYGLTYDESAVDTIPSVFDYALFSSGGIIQ